MEDETLVEIRERLVRIETKMDGVTEIRNTAAKAEEIANFAKNIAESNKVDILEIKANSKWIKNVLVTTIIGVFVALMRAFFHF